ncbi:MAG TPA: hypothetical protein VN649_14540 [Ramlibacter sp.]|nr:hypothetical protein [Ramlibacter sp.]
MKSVSKSIPRLTALALSLLAAAVQAQLVDEVELRRVGNDAVLQVRFVTPVQYLRTQAARSGDLGQVYYDVLPTPETLRFITSERRVAAASGASFLLLTDEATGSAERSRKLVLRFAGNTPFEARAGSGNRTIEIVLRGKGAIVASAAPVTRQGAFGIVLHRADSPNAPVPSVPVLLQDYTVSVRSRVLEGKQVYETVVSGIESLRTAQTLLASLRARFPQAALDEPPVSGPLAAVPAAPPGAAPGAAPGIAVPPSEAPARAQLLLAQARQAMDQADYTLAIGKLDELLALPLNAMSQDAQELIALARWRQGDPVRARAEFELYLKLYPEGPGAQRVREALLTLAPPPPVAEGPGQPAVTTTLTGSVATFYYGGQSKVRTQEFQDSPLSGLPELVSDASLSSTDQKQILSSVDLNWRRKDADTDLRLVVRDTYSADLLHSDKSKNKLSALYADYRLQSPGLSLRAGRQSPTGAGVMGRFDGLQVGLRIAPKWRVNAVAGQPSDSLLSSKRYFYGTSVDADAITPNIGGSLYAIEQRIDGQIDRRAVGSELRFQQGNLSASAILDRDIVLGGLNIASVQGSWQAPDNTVVNMLYDRRATPMLMLGNSLFFQNPVLTAQATRLQELLASQSLEALRQQVRDTTAYSTQGMLGVTKPVSDNWQVGGDVRLTNIGELPPVADILPNGQPGTGNVWSVGGQVIGSNLYSSRDTHVLVLNLLKAPTYRGTLASYNNSSALSGWLLEPSLRYYRQIDSDSTRTRRWAPGLRLTYRPTPKLAIESELSTEFSDVRGPARTESSRRTFYYFGSRYDL